MLSFKHNKKRNTGLVYEFLVRRLSKAMVEKDTPTYNRTLEILRKYYGEGTVLAEERELFDVVRNTRRATEGAARRILHEVQKRAQDMDVRKLDIKKSNLLKEINYSFGKDFFDEHRIPDYRVLASIQMVLDSARGGATLTESVSKIQLEEGIVQYMMSSGQQPKSSPERSEVDALVMRMMVRRFSEKYDKTLNAAQKKLLEKYIRTAVTGDQRPLRTFLFEEQDRVTKAFDAAEAMPEVVTDAEMKKMLGEARLRFKANIDSPLDVQVEEMMLFQKLAEEVESDA